MTSKGRQPVLGLRWAQWWGYPRCKKFLPVQEILARVHKNVKRVGVIPEGNSAPWRLIELSVIIDKLLHQTRWGWPLEETSCPRLRQWPRMQEGKNASFWWTLFIPHIYGTVYTILYEYCWYEHLSSLTSVIFSSSIIYIQSASIWNHFVYSSYLITFTHFHHSLVLVLSISRFFPFFSFRPQTHVGPVQLLIYNFNIPLFLRCLWWRPNP